MKKLLFFVVLILSIPMAYSETEIKPFTEWKEVCTIKGDGINMRKGPSTSDPTLGYISFGIPEEDGCYIPDLQWSDTKGKAGKFINEQLYTGSNAIVNGKTAGWVNLIYTHPSGNHSVWVSDKFASINPISPLAPGIFNKEENENLDMNLGILPGGRVIYYVDNEMEADYSIYLGSITEDGKGVFNKKIDARFQARPQQNDVSINKEDDTLVIYVGKPFLNMFDEEYGNISLNKFTPVIFDNMLKIATPVEKNIVVIASPEGGFLAI